MFHTLHLATTKWHVEPLLNIDTGIGESLLCPSTHHSHRHELWM